MFALAHSAPQLDARRSPAHAMGAQRIVPCILRLRYPVRCAHPYLSFPYGDCKAAFDVYQQVFGATPLFSHT